MATLVRHPLSLNSFCLAGVQGFYFKNVSTCRRYCLGAQSSESAQAKMDSQPYSALPNRMHDAPAVVEFVDSGRGCLAAWLGFEWQVPCHEAGVRQANYPIQFRRVSKIACATVVPFQQQLV